MNLGLTQTIPENLPLVPLDPHQETHEDLVFLKALGDPETLAQNDEI